MLLLGDGLGVAHLGLLLLLGLKGGRGIGGRSHRFRRSRLRRDVDCRGGLVRGVGGLGAILLGLRLGLGLGGVGV